MKPIVLSGDFAAKFTGLFKIDAITLWPFILVHPQSLNENIIRHETIHFKQAQELFVIPFYVLYLANYLYNLFKLRDDWLAYTQLLAEREAWEHQYEKDYLEKRKPYRWLWPAKEKSNA